MKRTEIDLDANCNNVGELRYQINDADKLLNDIESRVQDVLNLLDIKGIDDLDNIPRAYGLLKEISLDLY